MTCIHHWLIEMPHGEYSEGQCKLCGATRQFRNGAVLSKAELRAVGMRQDKDLVGV